MPNSINYAVKYQRELDQMLKQGALTSRLETPQVNWLNAQTFQVPSLSVSGFKQHSRNGGFNRGDVTATHEPYTLSFDRDVEFFVDQADVDESNQAASAANVTRVFMQENAIPEIDAYRLSKLATRAITEGQAAGEAVDNTNIYDKIKAALLPIRKYGPGNVVVYMSSQAMDALERSTDFTRKIEVTATGPQGIESRVTSIDGVQLIEVWDDERFHTSYDFTTGFIAASGSYAINFLVVAQPSVVAKAKINSIYLFQPGDHTQGDGYLYQNRMYHDLFVRKNKADGVYVSHGVTAKV